MFLRNRKNAKTLIKYISYALGQMSYGFSLHFAGYFLLYFYTKIFSIPPGILAVLFIIFKIIDAIDDQLISIFMSRITFSDGKYRRYYLLLPVPLAITTSLMYFTPNCNLIFKIIYATITYLLWEIILTAIYIASNAIMPYLTDDNNQRGKLTSIKIFFSILTILIIGEFSLKAIDFLGNGNQQLGFFLFAISFSIISIPFSLIAYFNLKEKRYINESNTTDLNSVRETLKFVKNNKPLLLILLMYMFFGAACFLKDQMAVYFLSYVLNNENLMGTFVVFSICPPLIMQLVIPQISKKIKKEICILIGILGSMLSMLIIFNSTEMLSLLFLGILFFGIFSSLPANLIYIVLAEFVDNTRKKHYIDTSSIFYGALGFFSKIGEGITLGLSLLVFHIIKFSPNDTTPVISMNIVLSIKYLFVFGTLIMLLISSFFMIIYLHHKKNEPFINLNK